MLLDSLISLFVIILWSFIIYKTTKMNPSVTPFVAVGCVVCFVSLLSLVNMLMISIWAVWIGAFGVFGFIAYKYKNSLKEDLKEFFTPGVILFVVFALFIFVVLWVKQPILSSWDEFSFWGTSQKVSKYHKAIYTYYDSSLLGTTTPPALAVLSVFFQPFGQTYLEWKAFFSYDVLLLASFCAWTGFFKKDKWQYAFCVFLFGFLTPFICEVYTKIVYVVPVYMSVMADVPLGAVFAGCLAVYFFAVRPNQAKGENLLFICPLLIVFTLMKDMGFAFSLIVTFIIFADLIFARGEFTLFKLKGFWAKLALGFLYGISTVFSFLAWTFHMSAVSQINRFELGGEQNYGMAQMLIVGIKELFSAQKSQKFLDIQAKMISALTEKPVTMLGNGVRTLFVITAVFILALILTKGRKNIIRIITLYSSNLIGFIAYYIFYLFIYTYIFKGDAYELPSYERYMYPYYIAFLAAGVFVLILSVESSRLKILSYGALWTFTVCVFGLFSYYVSYENTFFMYSPDRNSIGQNIIDSYNSIKDVIEEDDIIYCYSEAGDSGQRWFYYTYYMSPSVIVEDIPWIDNTNMTQEEYWLTWREYFIKHVEDEGITNFMLDYGDERLQFALGEDLGCNVLDFGLYDVAYFEITDVSSEDNTIQFKLLKQGSVS